MKWSPQQSEALDAVARWHREARAGGPQIFRVFGYAGTGKTTLAKHFASQISGATAYAAFTGKASLMMQRNGCEGAATIHSTIYKVVERADGSVTFVLDPESRAADAELLAIDECSMCDADIARDLMSFGKPILVLGDPAQLPPVKGAGYFTDAKPDVMLTEIHRQARENPIIQMATATRLGERLALGEYGASEVLARGVLTAQDILAHDKVLVGRNNTRATYNRRLRYALGLRATFPMAGDRLVCLRNDKAAGIFNGGLFRVLEGAKAPDRYGFLTMILTSDDFPDRNGIEVKVHRAFWEGGWEQMDWRDLKGSQQFDYGYALTTHKAQGSQWGSVVVYDESATFRDDWSRWLYTAITRAAEKVTVVQ